MKWLIQRMAQKIKGMPSYRFPETLMGLPIKENGKTVHLDDATRPHPTSKRLRIYTLTRDEYHALLDGKLGLNLFLLPEDVAIVGISEHYSFTRNEVALKLRSAAFEDIGVAGAIPDCGRLPMMVAATDEAQARFKADFEARTGIESL